jgi:ribosomal protein S18 acetylase RimI-like enzyme
VSSSAGADQRAFFGACRARYDSIALRPVTPADMPFLNLLYANTREQELAPVSWPEEQKRQFLADQFALQDQHYRRIYIDADFLLILLQDIPIGRIYVHRSANEIRVMDIALIAAQRGRGIGTSLLTELFEEAARTGSEVTLHVEPNNPAQRLYQRMGFRLIENRGVYDFLGWKPPVDTQPPLGNL